MSEFHVEVVRVGTTQCLSEYAKAGSLAEIAAIDSEVAELGLASNSPDRPKLIKAREQAKARVTAALTLTWGNPPPRVARRKLGAWSRIRAFEQQLCLTGRLPRGGGDGRRENAWLTYQRLPATVRAALKLAAQAGVTCSAGTHTTHDNWRWVPRKAHAVVRGHVPAEVLPALVLAGFRDRGGQCRAHSTWWGWMPT